MPQADLVVYWTVLNVPKQGIAHVWSMQTGHMGFLHPRLQPVLRNAKSMQKKPTCRVCRPVLRRAFLLKSCRVVPPLGLLLCWPSSTCHTVNASCASEGKSRHCRHFRHASQKCMVQASAGV